jgi:hypothetical protein
LWNIYGLVKFGEKRLQIWQSLGNIVDLARFSGKNCKFRQISSGCLGSKFGMVDKREEICAILFNLRKGENFV